MRHLQLVVLLVTLFVPLSQAQTQPCSATNRENCAYVSTFTGGKIYLFDVSAKTAKVINDGSSSVVPELPKAVVEGPDKLLYYADVASTCAIRRFDPFAPLGADGLNSTLETVLAGGSFCPAGLTFDVDGNLYANTQPFAGVYKIVQLSTMLPVSKVPLGSFGSATALTVLPASSTTSTGGAGIVFMNNGDLLFVGQSPDQVLFSSALNPPFTTATSLITGLQEPIGTVQNIEGKIFVANHLARNIVRCDSNGANCAEFATFTDSADRPVYLDANSEGNLCVATEQIVHGAGANGRIWLLTGPGSCPGINCNSAGSIPKISGKVAPAYGIGFSATSAIRAGTFGPGPDLIFGTADDNKSQFFDFGTSFFGLSYPNGVLSTHTVTVRAQEVYPGDLNFAIPGTKCNSYHGKKGKCVAYELVNFIPIKNVDYNDKYSAYVKYAGQIPIQPALLHDSRTLQDVLLSGGADFPDNIFNRFDLGPPGIDPGTGGESSDNFTAYISADLGTLGDVSAATFVTPIDASQITVVKKGKGFPVKVSIHDEFGNIVTTAILRLGVAQIVGNSLFPDVVRSNLNLENLFRVQSNIYMYNLITDDLPLGLHVVTAVSDKDSPFKIPALIALIDVRP